jgi:DNA-binding MarR family transcriptional regulator
MFQYPDNAGQVMSLVHIPEDIRHEFSIDQKGNVTASRRAVARLCGVEPSSVTRLLDRIKKKAGALQDKETLASIMGRDFQGVALNPVAASCIINYYAHEAGRYQTKLARSVSLAFTAIGFERWVQSELGWKSNKPEPGWMIDRQGGKENRELLADAIKDYIQRHREELSENAIKWMYTNATNKLYQLVYDRQARKLVEAIGCQKNSLRDNLSRKELQVLSAIEDVATQLIEQRDIHPSDAIVEAVERVLAVGRFKTMHSPKTLPSA